MDVVILISAIHYSLIPLMDFGFDCFIKLFILCILGKLKNRVYPPHQTLYIGDRAKFTCASIRTVTWEFERQFPKNSETEVLGDTNLHQLVLYDLQLNNSGKYLCYGQDNDFTYFQDEGLLEVVCKH